MEDIHRRIALLEIKDELVKKLKPCPFCGAYGASAKTVEWAVALWNQRPGETLEL